MLSFDLISCEDLLELNDEVDESEDVECLDDLTDDVLDDELIDDTVEPVDPLLCVWVLNLKDFKLDNVSAPSPFKEINQTLTWIRQF